VEKKEKEEKKMNKENNRAFPERVLTTPHSSMSINI